VRARFTMSFVAFVIRQRVVVNLLFVIACVAGLIAYLTLPVELDPEVSFESALVVTPYLGEAPEEVEKLITIPIEDEIEDLDGINRVYSFSTEGLSSIWVEYRSDVEDFRGALRDLRDEVQKVKDLPEDAEDTEVIELSTSQFPVISVVLSSDELTERQLKDVAEDIEDLIEDIDGVDQVEIVGTREREIWVEVDANKLYGYGLSLEDVGERVRRRNLTFAGGEVYVGRDAYLVRAIGEYADLDEMRDTVVTADGAGKFVQLKDVARVLDTFEKETTRARLNGKPAVLLSVLKDRKGESFSIVRDLKRTVPSYLAERRLPVDVAYINDTTTHISENLSTVKKNATLGIILVALLLYLFIGFRSAFLTAIGIPFTFLAAFAFFPFAGITMNTVSLFSLVLVLGLIVDDAIVVIENNYRYTEQGLPPSKAAVVGTQEVAAPVTSAVLTTMMAFLPMLMMTGIVGSFLNVIPKVVAFALLASLFEALVVLPSHIADFGRRPGTPIATPLLRWMEGVYVKLIFKVLRRRYLAIGAIIVLAAGALALIPYIGIDLFRFEEASRFSIQVRAPEGSRLEEMDRIVRQVEQHAAQLPRKDVNALVSRVGVIFGEYMVERGSNLGEVWVDLVEKDIRETEADDMIAELRPKVRGISGIKSVEFLKITGGPPVGMPVAVRIRGETYDGVAPVIEEIESTLRSVDGVYDIRNDFEPGKNQIRIHVDEERAAIYGLSPGQIAAGVHNSFDGLIATEYRKEGEEIDVVVKLKESQRDDLTDLENLRIKAPSAELIRFGNVASYSVERGPSTITRRDFIRTVSVTAEVDRDKITPTAVNKILERKFPSLMAKYPKFSFALGGEYTKTQESFSSLKKAFAVALLLIYLILGTQFQSFTQPLVVMFTVPFAFIGVIVGLLVNGDTFTIVAFIGVVALAGIVVNDSIVLMDFINKRRQKGGNKWRSIVESGRVRMRPILLTSLTTIFGLLPMALGIGGRSEVWGPLAVSIIWGLSFSTFLTLFIIPAFYSMITGWAERFSRG